MNERKYITQDEVSKEPKSYEDLKNMGRLNKYRDNLIRHYSEKILHANSDEEIFSHYSEGIKRISNPNKFTKEVV